MNRILKEKFKIIHIISFELLPFLKILDPEILQL